MVYLNPMVNKKNTNQTTENSSTEEKKGFDWKTALNFILSLAIVIVLFKVADIHPRELWAEIKKTDITWFTIASLFFTVSNFHQYLSLNKLTNVLSYKLKYPKALMMYFEAMFANNFFPSNLGGDALRSYELGKQTKNWLRAASTVLVERMFGFVVMFSFIPLGMLFLEFSSIKDTFPIELKYVSWGGFACMVIGIASYKLWSQIGFGPIRKIKYAVEEYTQCNKTLMTVGIWSIITYTCFQAGSICSAQAVGISFNEVPLWYWMIVTPATVFAGVVIPAVKGASAKEAGLVFFLALFSVSTDKALAAGLVAAIATLISTLPGITIVFSKLGKLTNKSK